MSRRNQNDPVKLLSIAEDGGAIFIDVKNVHGEIDPAGIAFLQKALLLYPEAGGIKIAYYAAENGKMKAASRRLIEEANRNLPPDRLITVIDPGPW